MAAAANALWNLYAAVDHTLDAGELGAVAERAKLDRPNVERVHASLVNCMMSLDAMKRAEAS